MTHRTAARFVKNNYGQTSSVTQMLKELGWESLADRRRHLILAFLYEIINHLAAVSVNSILIPAECRNALTCTSEVVFKLCDTSCFNQHPWMHLNLNTTF